MLHELFITNCTNGTLIMNPFTESFISIFKLKTSVSFSSRSCHWVYPMTGTGQNDLLCHHVQVKIGKKAIQLNHLITLALLAEIGHTKYI